jgi:hypothetical protein
MDLINRRSSAFTGWYSKESLVETMIMAIIVGRFAREDDQRVLGGARWRGMSRRRGRAELGLHRPNSSGRDANIGSLNDVRRPSSRAHCMARFCRSAQPVETCPRLASMHSLPV